MIPLASQDQSSPLLTPFDLYLFNEGEHIRLFEKFGADFTELDSRRGTHFAVWAPNAERISVVGDFNYWNPDFHPMTPRASSGVWEAFVPELGQGEPARDCMQLHAGAAARLPRGRASRGTPERNPEQQCHDLRREKRGEFWRENDRRNRMPRI